MNRREMLVASAGVAAAAALPTGLARAAVALAVYDSRSPESAAFARQARAAGARLFDMVDEDAASWRNARAALGLAPRATVIGMTGWSDWTLLRGFLEERGFRVQHEMRVDCCAANQPGKALAQLMEAEGRTSRGALWSTRDMTLFAWRMG